MKNQQKKQRNSWGTNTQLMSLSSSTLFVAALAGCGDSSNDGKINAGRAASAVIVGTTITSGDQANTYVMALPDVPGGRLSTGDALEFGGWARVRTWAEHVFVFEPEGATLHRYVVTRDFKLQEDGPALRFTVAGASDGMDLNIYDAQTAYASPYSAGQATIVEWNPTTMAISREIPTTLPSPTVPSFLDSNGFVGQFSGAEAWHVYGNDYDSLRFNDLVMLGFLDPGAATLTVIEHQGCAPNIKGYVVDGDLYVVGAGTNAETYSNYNTAYAKRNPNCVLRVKAGERRFDPEYFVNLSEITASRAVQNTKLFDDEHLIVEFWDPADPFPQIQDDYWTASSFKSIKLNLKTGESEPIDTLFPKATQGSYADFVMDDKPYFTIVASGFNDTTVKVVEGTKLREIFSTPGYLHTLARVK